MDFVAGGALHLVAGIEDQIGDSSGLGASIHSERSAVIGTPAGERDLGRVPFLDARIVLTHGGGVVDPVAVTLNAERISIGAPVRPQEWIGSRELPLVAQCVGARVKCHRHLTASRQMLCICFVFLFVPKLK